MTQMRTRSKVQNIPMPDLDQTAAQSPGAMMPDLEPASLGESCKRTRELHRGKPADSEVQSQVNKDGRAQQKDCAQQQVKRKPHSADDTYRRGKRRRIRIQQKDEISHNSKAWVAPACNAREKLLEQDAQSHLTAVRKTLRSR